MLLFFLSGYVFGQSIIDPYRSQYNDIVEPAPTSQALQKYLGYPVSPATGLADIQIPLYNMKVRNLEIPLVLKYHSAGIKIQDHPGLVGYGWSLFPGFKISRTIMGKPDDKYPVIGTFDPSALSFDQLQQRLTNLSIPASYVDVNTTEDGQYDVFSILMPNLNGTFILLFNNNTYQVRSIPGNPLKIKPIVAAVNNGLQSLFTGFEVDDEKGIKYIFGGDPAYREISDVRSSNVITGWMLKEIVFPDGEKINYTYTTIYEHQTFTPSYYTVSDNALAVNGLHEDVKQRSDQKIGNSAGYHVSFTQSAISGAPNELKVPTLISSRNQTIAFHYAAASATRTRLSRISISGVNRDIVFRNNASDFLNEIDISGEDKYGFDYYTQPFQFSSAQIDWWGFHNGRGNSNNIPYYNVPIRVFMGSNTSYFIGGANREPNAGSMFAKSLKSITYPTGGKFTIEYEPHKFAVDGVQKIGAGLRVRSTETLDPVNLTTINRTYEYEEPHYTAITYPQPSDFIRENTICFIEIGPASYTIRSRTISSLSPNANISNNATPVWYGKVTETGGGGKTIYYYDYFPDHYNNRLSVNGMSEFHLLRFNRLAYSSPNLIKKEVYLVENTVPKLLQSTINEYTPSLASRTNIQGFIVMPFKRLQTSSGDHRNSDYTYGTSTTSSSPLNLFGSPFAYKGYYISTDEVHLSKTITKYYDGSSFKADSVSYTYDLERPYNLSRKITQTSDAQIYDENFYYSNNVIPHFGTLNQLQRETVANMDSANFKTTIFERKISKNGVDIGAKLIGYKKHNNVFYRPEVEYNMLKNGSMTLELSFLNYDSYGNLTEVKEGAGAYTSLIYGYDGRYPVGKLLNTRLSEITSAFGGTNATSQAISDLNSNGVTESSIRQYMQTLRSSLPNAQVSTHTYLPLIGMASKTSPSGITEFYEYDANGRLAVVKDHDGHIIRAYCYNYAGQVIDCSTSTISFVNVEASRTFRKNNCPSGQQGGLLTYTVPAGRYSSTESQTAADQLAQNEITSMGQAYANQNGGCTTQSNCTRYRIRIPTSAIQANSGNMFVGFASCASGLYQVVSIHNLEAYLDDSCPDCAVVEICVNNSTPVSLHYSQHGGAVLVPNAEIISMGNCN